MNYLKRLLLFSIGPIGASVLSFITIPIITSSISPNDFGIGNIFLLYLGLFISVCYLGIDQAFTREFYEEQNKENLFKNAIFLPLVFSSFITILILIFPKLTAEFIFGDDRYSNISLWLGYCIILSVVERFALLYLRMQEKAILFSLINILSKFLVLLFTFVYIKTFENNYLVVIYPVIAAQTLSSCFSLFIVSKKFEKKFSINLNYQLIKKMINFGFPILISSSIFILITSLDRLFLQRWSNYQELGIYILALKIAALLNVLQISFSNFWIPTAYKWNEEKKDIIYYELVNKLLIFVLSLVFVVILASKDIIVESFFPEYLKAKYLIPLLCIQPIVYTISETTVLGIVFSRKSKINIIISVVTLISSVVFSIIFIPLFDSIGAAIASSLSFIIFLIARTELSRKYWEGIECRTQYLTVSLMFLSSLYFAFYNISLMKVVIVLFLVLIIQKDTIKNIYDQIICLKK